MDVEIAKKKTPGWGRIEESLDEQQQHQHQSLSSILVVIIMIAMVSSVCLCAYQVAVRVSRLEQRVDTLSHRCASSAQLPTTSTPVADSRRRTSEASTASSTAPSTTSFAGTWTPITDQDEAEDWGKLSNDIDEEVNKYDNLKRSIYRTANSIFGKIGRIASEEITLQVIRSKM